MTATTSTVKTTQKQYTTTPKTIITSSPQTSIMKPVGTSTSQNRNKIKTTGCSQVDQIVAYHDSWRQEIPECSSTK